MLIRFKQFWGSKIFIQVPLRRKIIFSSHVNFEKTLISWENELPRLISMNSNWAIINYSMILAIIS